ncbi:Hpt domain-containing protein [Kordiimonas marina]|uniref:Hpt domain-containing protein n=1 Tax=Kordiimonas marina TaxID=2872312 RepID=UPI001FF1BFC0|nr:Hpt domain-containing protein [Kordiimonas marina]MCJ9430303.1 Hpt domain-containing protein [Kordiimonas marina]
MQESDWDESVILDAGHLRGFTAGDTDLEITVLTVFTDNTPGYLETLRASDGENWKSDAHKLKGAARSIGAWRLARVAERAEFMGNPAPGDPRRDAVLDELKGRLDELIRHIEDRCRALEDE